MKVHVNALQPARTSDSHLVVVLDNDTSHPLSHIQELRTWLEAGRGPAWHGHSAACDSSCRQESSGICQIRLDTQIEGTDGARMDSP